MEQLTNPCEKCPKDGTKRCRYLLCKPWVRQYKNRQKKINAYAKKVLPAYYASIGKGGDFGGGK